jgi:polar amino acid transport system substrate-binding protein
MLLTMSRTVERNPQYQWIGPLTERAFGLYEKVDSNLKITSLEDARKVASIGVYRNDVRDLFFTRLGFTNLERASDNVSNFKKFMLGRVTLFAGSVNDIQQQAEAAGYKQEDVKLAYTFLRVQLYIAVSKQTDPALVEKWNATLNEMKKDKVFAAIHTKYYPGQALPGPAFTKF